MFATWLSVLTICILGAMTPGQSLAVVLRHTLMGGRAHGCATAVAHSIGIGLYALLAMSGLAVIITTSPEFFRAFQWAGAAYLAWMGIQGLRARPATDESMVQTSKPSGAVRDGFLVAFLNPKVAVFLLALFSQVVGTETTWFERSIYSTTVWLVDMLWYLLVAWLFSTPSWLRRLKHNAVWFERAFGLILLALAARLVIETLR